MKTIIKEQISCLFLFSNNINKEDLKWNNFEPVAGTKNMLRLVHNEDYNNEYLRFTYNKVVKTIHLEIQVPLFCFNVIDCDVKHKELMELKNILHKHLGIDISKFWVESITSTAFVKDTEKPFLLGNINVDLCNDYALSTIVDNPRLNLLKDTDYILRYDLNFKYVDYSFEREVSFDEILTIDELKIELQEPFMAQND